MSKRSELLLVIGLLAVLSAGCGDDLPRDVPEGGVVVHLLDGDGHEVTCASLAAAEIRLLVGPVRVPGQAYPILWPDAELVECGDGPAIFIPGPEGDTIAVLVDGQLAEPGYQPLAGEIVVELPEVLP